MNTNGPKTWGEAFPPICIRSHWDPTAVTKHILPEFKNQPSLLFDPRPSSRICYQYYTTEIDEPTNPLNESKVNEVFPPGGAARIGFPYANYVRNINTESDIRLLNLPLTKCANKKYIPENDMPNPTISNNTVPGSIHDILSPFATLIQSSTNCRLEDDISAWNRSSRLFYNPTKYDRTQNKPQNIKLAESVKSLQCPY